MTDRIRLLATALSSISDDDLAEVLRVRGEIIAGVEHDAEPMWRVTVSPIDDSTSSMIRCVKSIRDSLKNDLGVAREMFRSGIVVDWTTFAEATKIASDANAAYHAYSKTGWSPFRVEAVVVAAV